MDCFSKWGVGGSWNPRFTRRFNDWELDEVDNLLGRLCEERVMLDEEDRVRWPESKDGNFSVIPLQSFRAGIINVLSNKDYLELLGAAKNVFLCLGSFLGKSSNFRLNSKEGSGFSN